ncbi:hypothetical protein LV85_00012 [Algoriphagus chordae]|uniref:Uncharacterized protein n=1 Tax=Algoriphagus chordae TaxID=237019 RepID=A0A2W7RCK1_9BACT|nr:hypothetical protein LV85_00012 [Algoriphagus chordae]
MLIKYIDSDYQGNNDNLKSPLYLYQSFNQLKNWYPSYSAVYLKAF